MKSKQRSLFQVVVMMFFVMLLTTACTTEPGTPIPLPTARVPSLLEVSGAMDRWVGGNNTDYYVTVEETTNEGIFLYRIVIADDKIQVAQRMEKIAGKWQPPVSISDEIAENYTVDALLARVLRDAKGEGPAPMNMFTVFDSFTGFPTVVEAKSMPSYTEDGKLRLNREFSYTISVTVDALLEDTFGFNKNPLLTLSLSGGDNADCSVLRIFDDRTSIYSDNCRQILLQIIPPEESFVQAETLAKEFAALEDIRGENGQASKVVLNGTGSAAADEAILDDLWSLAYDLNDLLSQPIGTGVTLLTWDGEKFFGYDMRANLAQPAGLEFRSPFFGGITDGEGIKVIFADSAGLKWLDTVSGDTGTYSANPPGNQYVPHGITKGNRILLQRYTDGSDVIDWGWISQDNRSWHPLAESIECITGLSSNYENEYVAVATTSTASCEAEADLWITNLITGDATPFELEGETQFAPSWSLDGKTIAITATSTDAEGVQTSSLYTINPIDQTVTKVLDTVGELTATAWHEDGERVYYGLSGTGEDSNGLYEYDLATEDVTNSLIGENLSPVSFDPTGEFLAFFEGSGLRVWVIDFGRVYPITQEGLLDNPFIGWLNSTTNQ